MKWLHISDIHFNFKGYESSTVRNKLLSALKDLRQHRATPCKIGRREI